MMSSMYRARWVHLGLAAALAEVGCSSGGTGTAQPGSYHAMFEQCMRAPGATEATCEAYAHQQAGPTTPANDEGQWAELERAAATMAQAKGPSSTEAPARLQTVGFIIEHPLNLQGGHCYDAALAWSSKWTTLASVTFVADAGTPPVNDNVGGQSERLNAPGGALSFCADHDGAANLTLTAIGEHGASITNDRLEYALVLGQRTESAADAAARRQREAKAATEARAQIETNIFISETRDRGEAFATACARCRKLANDCIAQESREGPSGDAVRSCGNVFETCAQAVGTDARGTVLCNPGR